MMSSIVMAHWSLRRELLVMLLMHLHVIESLVIMRPIHHVTLILVRGMLEHILSILQRERIHRGGGSGGRTVGSSGVSRRLIPARTLGVVEQVRTGLGKPQYTISHSTKMSRFGAVAVVWR